MGFKVPAGYRLIKENELDALIVNAFKPEYFNKPILNSNASIAGMPEFNDLIDNIINQQLDLTAAHIEQAKLEDLQRLDFMQAINPALDAMYYSKASNIQDFTQQFYNAGKKAGFKDMQVKSFMGAADTHALYSLSQYSFGLIRNVSNDLRRSIGHEVYTGVANGYGIPEIAENIQKLGIKPIYNPYRQHTMSPAERSKLIAHTEAVRGVNQGIIVSFENYGVNLVNSNTNYKKPCQDCKDIAAGSPYPINKIPRGGPPYHSGCYCALTAAAEPAETAKDPTQYYNLISKDIVTVGGHPVPSVPA